MNHLTTVLNHKRLIGVGFSMGANILIKYLGEEAPRQECFECGISVCQGYDILRYQVAFFLTLLSFHQNFTKPVFNIFFYKFSIVNRNLPTNIPPGGTFIIIKVTGMPVGKLKLNPKGRPMWVWLRLKLSPKGEQTETALS